MKLCLWAIVLFQVNDQCYVCWASKHSCVGYIWVTGGAVSYFPWACWVYRQDRADQGRVGVRSVCHQLQGTSTPTLPRRLAKFWNCSLGPVVLGMSDMCRLTEKKGNYFSLRAYVLAYNLQSTTLKDLSRNKLIQIHTFCEFSKPELILLKCMGDWRDDYKE